MKFEPIFLKNAYLVQPEPFVDERGWFARTFCKREFEHIGHSKEWVQLNHSVTLKKGAIRGMHFQLPPFREIKMVKCIAGAVFDVIVDLRQGSPTFLRWFGAELSSANRTMMYIPEGFAHGFQCLTDNCELIYHHTEFYKPEAESGLRFDDPAVGIEWPLQVSEISARDMSHAFLTESFKGI